MADHREHWPSPVSRLPSVCQTASLDRAGGLATVGPPGSSERKGQADGWLRVAHLDEIEEFSDAGCHYRPIRHHLGITAFGVTAWTARAAGDLVINEHDEGDPTADQELFLVLRGHAVFELDGDGVDASAGTLVYAPPRTKRMASAKEEGTIIIAMEGTPGQGYEPRGWELWAPLAPLYAGERVRRGRRRSGHPGRSQSAVAHVVLQPRLLREPLRSDKRRARSPQARRGDVGGVSPFCKGRLRPGSDPRRTRVQATDR